MEPPMVWKPLTQHFPKRYTKPGLTTHRNRQGYQPLPKTTGNHRNETTIMLLSTHPTKNRVRANPAYSVPYRNVTGQAVCSPRQHRDLPPPVFHLQRHSGLH